jgi:starch synthase
MKTLFASSEIFPYAKTGGLADVAQALPQALSKELEIISVMPLYGFMSPSQLIRDSFEFNIMLGGISYDITLYRSKNQNITTYFIAAPLLSTTKSLYHDDQGEYANNDLRFGIFCAAVVELALHLNVDLVHLNDWHSALVALFIKERTLPIKSIFTIHNLAYQGVFHASSLQRLGIDSRYFTMEGMEFYGALNFMKAGIAYCDRITTVSPQYAKEILTKEFGCGLEGFLNLHRDKLSGILNGIDTYFFNPKEDKALPYTYDKNDIASKYLNKKALIQEVGLKDPRKPLFVMISRLVHQKGFDLLLQVLPAMLKKRLNLLLLVDGKSSYQEPLVKLAKKHDNFVLLEGYDENLSHRIYAGGDFLLMPSLYEPCGLNQMIAMRYGTIAFVHGVGGLFDSVHENSVTCGQGIVFSKPTKKAFLDALERALKLKSATMNIAEMIRFNMECDFSFEISAKRYLQLYKTVLLLKDIHD